MTKEHYLLEATDIAKAFSGVPALHNGHLRLRRGRVHALCGGNGAGKSTFLNILMGLLQRDQGSILLDGQPVHFHGPADALHAGISMISQELEPVPGMSVAENLFLGRQPRKLGCLVDYRQLYRNTRTLLTDLGIELSPRTMMSELSLAQIQLVEIAKAISWNARIIIMDEPTSAIGDKETELLFAAIRRLKANGTGIVYVSHRMNELYSIADDYTIFRDGQFIATGTMDSIDRATLINTILGAELEEEFTKQNAPTRDILMEVKDYSLAPLFENINLTLHKGEILGIFGLMGAGRSEFLEALFGLRDHTSGSATINGKPYAARHPREAMQRGLALVTEDRKGSGLVTLASVRHNTSMASLPEVSNWGVMQFRKEESSVQSLIERFSIKTASQNMAVQHMSGGNQQKVVLAKWMRTRPDILILDEPTRGVDVGAKREIYQFMSEFSRGERAVIMVSSEIPEILGMSDRVVVFKRGRITGELAGADLTQDKLAGLAS